MEYGFYGRLKKEFPSQVIVDLNEACNYECVHCPQGRMKREGRLSGARLPKELSKKMVDEVARHGRGITQQIRYTADGEPFLHPDIMEILRYASLNSGTVVSVTTNGSLLDGEMMADLQKAGLGLIDFSLDAFYEDTYAEIRVNGNLDSVRNNVLKMLDMRRRLGSSTKIVVSFVLQDRNRNEADEFRKYWEAQGADWVVVRKLHTAGGSLGTARGQENRKGIYPCVYLWERIGLNQHGQLSYCPTDWNHSRIVCTDYSQCTIREAWTGELYERLRMEHLSGRFEAAGDCMGCMDRFLTIWPETGETAYGDMISRLDSMAGEEGADEKGSNTPV